MKHLLLYIIVGFLGTSAESQDLIGKKVVNIAVADITGTATSGHLYDFGTTSPLPEQQAFRLRLVVNKGTFRVNKISIFYGAELPFRTNNVANESSEFLIGLYPYISFVKLLPIRENVYVTSEFGFRVGYEYQNARGSAVAPVNMHTWQTGAFIKPITAIWYLKKNIGLTLSPWTGQLTYQHRTSISVITPQRKVITDGIGLSGALIPAIGIQLKLK